MLPGAAVLAFVAAQLPAEEALKTFRLPTEFRIELFAAEPLVVDPVCIAFDEDGRCYVAEMRDYPSAPPLGTVKRLEDLDGDGRADRAVLFADGVAAPSGLQPWRGGLLVASSPDLLFLKDTDGDGRADVRERLITGFGKTNEQHLPNNLSYGIDNWITGANGGSDGALVALGPGTRPRLNLKNADFRFRPDGSALEPLAGRSQFGNTFDDWGRRFICRHDNHLIHPVLPNQPPRNRRLAVPTLIDEDVSDHGRIPRLFPISPRDDVFTTDTDSSCAVTIYRGGAFPPAYDGNAFVCEPVLNLVHRDILVPAGVTFRARRADEGVEFLASTDPWFRPVNLCVGPEGALYVVDMYRAVIEHPDYIPKEIQKKLPLRAGDDRGRIYRIVHGAPAPAPKLSGATTDALVESLAARNAWRRLAAQRLLVERRDETALGPLRRMARASDSPLGRLHALWTLEGVGALDRDLIASALQDPEPRLREQALQWGGVDPKTIARLADDPDPRVRLACAVALGRTAEPDTDALLRIAARDLADPWVRWAVLGALDVPPVRVLTEFHERHAALLQRAAPGALEWVRILAGLVDPSEAAEWLRFAASEPEPSRWREVAVAVTARARPGSLRAAGVEATAAAWVDRARVRGADPAAPLADRLGAIELVAAAGDLSSNLPWLRRLLRAQEPVEVQLAAIRALSGRDLLEDWDGLTWRVRREALDAFFSRGGDVGPLLDALEAGRVKPNELTPEQQRRIAQVAPDRAKRILGAEPSADRQKETDRMVEQVAALRPDPARGRQVFVELCATCHRLGGEGHRVGPDLESVAGRDARTLLTNILDPNRAVDPAYRLYRIRTADGRDLSGVVATETATSLTLRRALGVEETLLRRDIVELAGSTLSMMPEGLERQRTPQDFADLLAFLRGGGR
jgi:putative membrane-bound dehydrogenase-like protein